MDNTLITSDRLDTFSKLRPQVPEGLIAEVGVYKGGSLKVLAKLFDDRPVIGFDTFTGLPEEHWNEEELHKPGDFNDTSIESVQEFLRDCPNVVLVEGVFPYSAIPFKDKEFALVHADMDFYLGTTLCIEWFWPRLVKGGIIVFDDYKWANCPGVQRALGEFGYPIHTLTEYQAYIIKP